MGKRKDVKRFETSPERVRRVRQAAVGKRVAHQEIAEFIMNTRIGNGNLAEQRETQRNHENKNRTARNL